jgi:DNA-binding beta-propeller fold protein YncE
MNEVKRTAVALVLCISLVNPACKKHPADNSGLIPTPDKKWMVTTIAGDGDPGFQDGPSSTARLRAPLDVAVDDEGLIYVSDAINHRIRIIANGQVTTFAGQSMADTTSGSRSAAKFLLPGSLALDRTGDLYTLDIEDPRIRKVTGDFVSVVAGSGINGFADGDADSARFGRECSGIAIDEWGNIYVMDWKNRRLRKINTTGQVSTIAGSGQIGFVNGPSGVAQFFNPTGIAIDKQGNLFVGDWNRIRKITPDGNVSTFAGKDSTGFKDGAASEALFTDINDLAIDDWGNLFVSDENRIRKITPQGTVSTIAGSTGGYMDGEGTVAKFLGPVGLATDKQGNIYVADDHNNRIRKISFQ